MPFATCLLTFGLALTMPSPAAAEAAALDDAGLGLARLSARALAGDHPAEAAALATQAKVAELSAEDAATWYCRRALWLIRLGRPRLAEQDYLAARQRVPADTETLAGLAHTALLQNRPEDARRLHSLAREPFGDEPPMNDIYSPGKQHLNLVSALLDDSLARFSAERFFTMELKADAFYYAGRAEEFAGHLEEAEDLYRTAVAEQPEDFPVARNALAKVAGAGLEPARLEPQDPNLGRMRQYVELCLKQNDLYGAELFGAQLLEKGRDWPTFAERERLWARVQAACFLSSGGQARDQGVRALTLAGERDDGSADTTALRTRLWRELGAADPEWYRLLSPAPHRGSPDAPTAAALRSLVAATLPAETDPRLAAADAAWRQAWDARLAAGFHGDDAKRRDCADLARVGAEIALLRRLAAKPGSAAQAQARQEAAERLTLSLLLEPEDFARLSAVREHPVTASLGLALDESGTLAQQLRVVPAYQRLADEMLPLVTAAGTQAAHPEFGRAFCDQFFAVLATEMPPEATAPWREELVRTVWRLTGDPVRTCDALDWAVQTERAGGQPIHLDWLPAELWQTPFGRAYLEADTWLTRLQGDPARLPASLAEFGAAPSVQCRLLQAKWLRSGDVVLWANDTVGILQKFQGRTLAPTLVTSRSALIGRLLDRLALECVDASLLPGEPHAVGRSGYTAGEAMENTARATRDREILSQLQPLLARIEVPPYVRQDIDQRFQKLGAWVSLRLGDEAGIRQSPLVWHEYAARQERLAAEANARARLAEAEERERLRLVHKEDDARQRAASEARAVAALQSLTTRIQTHLGRGEIRAAKALLAKVRRNPDVIANFSSELDRLAESLDGIDQAWTAQARVAQQNLANRDYGDPAYVPRKLSPEMQQLLESSGLDGRGAARFKQLK